MTGSPDEIVNRLLVSARGYCPLCQEQRPGVHADKCLMAEAAAVIGDLARAGDRLVAVLRSGSDMAWDSAIDSWEAVRHG